MSGVLSRANIMPTAPEAAPAFLVEFHLALAIVPVLVLLAALAWLLCGPFLARRANSPRLQRIGQHRIEIASGLILMGIALKTLIQHAA
jgi:threonine/homoserine/homoserine lactone efflux protein